MLHEQVGALAWLAEEADPSDGAAFRTVCASPHPDTSSPSAAYTDRIVREKAAALMRLYDLPLFDEPGGSRGASGNGGSSGNGGEVLVSPSAVSSA
jgi:hypothetical protein